MQPGGCLLAITSRFFKSTLSCVLVTSQVGVSTQCVLCRTVNQTTKWTAANVSYLDTNIHITPLNIHIDNFEVDLRIVSVLQPIQNTNRTNRGQNLCRTLSGRFTSYSLGLHGDKDCLVMNRFVLQKDVDLFYVQDTFLYILCQITFQMKSRQW